MFKLIQRWVPIPSQFHSLFHDGLFPHCVDCNRDLLSDDCLYSIERVFRGSEPICEMAICLECRHKITEELSRESMMRINAFVEERFDAEARYVEAQGWSGDQLENWLGHCALLKIPAAESRDYQIAALCRGKLMSIDLLPIMISGEAAEQMQKLMSKQTRDRLGEMVDEFFGMPSEFADGPYSPTFW